MGTTETKSISTEAAMTLVDAMFNERILQALNNNAEVKYWWDLKVALKCRILGAPPETVEREVLATLARLESPEGERFAGVQ